MSENIKNYIIHFYADNFLWELSCSFQTELASISACLIFILNVANLEAKRTRTGNKVEQFFKTAKVE